MNKKEHSPAGDPCDICGEPAFKHRPAHTPIEDPCTKCHLAAWRHRPESVRALPYRKRRQKKRQVAARGKYTYLGIDGEGVNDANGFHRYVFLAVSNEDGSRRWEVRNPDGLTTLQCLHFLISLPKEAKVFAYAFNYDLTKILVDIPDNRLHPLFRPELRPRRGKEAVKGPRPVLWNGWRLNLQGTKFSVQYRGKRRVVWDIFKFFQGPFVGALEDWKIGDEALHKRMRKMKASRANFRKIYLKNAKRIEEYCYEECACMATLAHKLVDAHEAVGLHLRSFYGAGSSASAMLKVMGIKETLVPVPKKMVKHVASAFFGGRFENSVIGPIKGPIFNYDISSAYPYQATFLPCLQHGMWRKTKVESDITTCKAALVRYRLGKSDRADWGPFPFRIGKNGVGKNTDSKGSICFPVQGGGGWIWRDEYLAGKRAFGNVEFREAWVWESTCDCQPFAALPKYYVERIRIGKEGPGIVLKLAMNSCYGKLAQSVGNALYNSWIWAGMITSGCRAQILDMMALHKDPANLLMIATDGIYTREELIPPLPRETHTDVPDKDGKRKPLGGWEMTRIDKGVFVARPGIYFPNNPTKKELKKIRARGIGKAVVLENYRLIVAGWKKHGARRPVFIKEVSRFCGAKSSISCSGKPGYEVYRRADGSGSVPKSKQISGLPHDMPAYGQWVRRPVEMSFAPKPKRLGVNPDGLTLKVRRMPRRLESAPYDKAVKSQELLELKALADELLEQPDCDMSELGAEDFLG